MDKRWTSLELRTQVIQQQYSHAFELQMPKEYQLYLELIKAAKKFAEKHWWECKQIFEKLSVKSQKYKINSISFTLSGSAGYLELLFESDCNSVGIIGDLSDPDAKDGRCGLNAINASFKAAIGLIESLDAQWHECQSQFTVVTTSNK